jgi:DNA transposition AAA+ family ATPase
METSIQLTPPRANGAHLDMDDTFPSEATPLPPESEGHNIRSTWPWSLNNIYAGIAHYPPEAKRTLVAAFQWCTNDLHPMAKSEFAVRVGSKDNTIYKIFAGKYFHPDQREQRLQPSEKLIAAINEFLAQELKRFQSGTADLVITPTLKKITTLCDLARESKTIAYIEGPSHIGKTWAIEKHYKPLHDANTIFTRIPASGGATSLLRELAKSCGQSPNGGDLRGIFSSIISAVKKNPDTVWIFDEMSHLDHTYSKNAFFKIVEIIRDIHDLTKCSMVHIFTDISGFRRATSLELQQAWRRGPHKLILPSMPTIGDLTAIFAHHGLEFPAADLVVKTNYFDRTGKKQTIESIPREIIRTVAQDEALLAITERIRYAKTLARKAAGPLTWSHFVTAHLLIAKQSKPEENWV